MNVIRHNAHERHNRDIPCHDANFLRAYSIPLPDPVPDLGSKSRKVEEVEEKQWDDWAGVQGVWLRAISFMDYRDLQEYNVGHLPHIFDPYYDLLLTPIIVYIQFNGTLSDNSLPTSIFEGNHFAEAFRLIRAHFIVTSVEARGPPKYPHRPTIHFVGETTIPSHPLDNHIYRITKGTVRMTDSGNIKWSFVRGPAH
jgi:hypothetical protein